MECVLNVPVSFKLVARIADYGYGTQINLQLKHKACFAIRVPKTKNQFKNAGIKFEYYGKKQD